MAYLPYDENKDQTNAQGSAILGGDSGSGGVVSGGALNTGSGVVGRGGANAFSNIQNYLTANAHNEASKNLLADSLGKGLEQERERLGSETKSLQSKKSEIDQKTVGKDEASKLVADYSAQYPGSGQAQTGYADAKARVQGFLGYQPEQVQPSYAISGKVQEQGRGVSGGIGDFSQLMQGIYNQTGASPATLGQSALQSQLDSHNAALQNEKQRLANEYKNLQLATGEGSDYAKAGQALQQSYKDLPKSQKDLMEYLMGQKAETGSAIQNKVKSANELAAKAEELYLDPVRQLNSQDQRTFQDWLGSGAQGSLGQWDIRPSIERSYATSANLAAAKPEVNRFNTIADFLGSGDVMNQAQVSENPFSLANYNVGFSGRDVGAVSPSKRKMSLQDILLQYEKNPSGSQTYINGIGSKEKAQELAALAKQAREMGLISPAQGASAEKNYDYLMRG